MNWEAIGAIGEILGAAGVIVTVGYLAFQIRQNNRHLAHEAQRSRAQAVRDNMRALADNAEVCVKDGGGETLTATEAFRMERLWFGMLWSYQTSFLQLPRHQIMGGGNRYPSHVRDDAVFTYSMGARSRFVRTKFRPIHGRERR